MNWKAHIWIAERSRSKGNEQCYTHRPLACNQPFYQISFNTMRGGIHMETTRAMFNNFGEMKLASRPIVYWAFRHAMYGCVLTVGFILECVYESKWLEKVWLRSVKIELAFIIFAHILFTRNQSKHLDLSNTMAKAWQHSPTCLLQFYCVSVIE